MPLTPNTPATPANPGNIISLLGLESLPEERRAAMIEKMTDLVQKRVIIRLMESLSDADAAEAEKMADKPEEMMAFLMSKQADMPAMVAQEAEAVKQELALGVLEDESAE